MYAEWLMSFCISMPHHSSQVPLLVLLIGVHCTLFTGKTRQLVPNITWLVPGQMGRGINDVNLGEIP